MFLNCCYIFQYWNGWAAERASKLELCMSYSSSCYHHLHHPIKSSNKIQNGDILVPANPGPPGKWPLKLDSGHRGFLSTGTPLMPSMLQDHDVIRPCWIALTNGNRLQCPAARSRVISWMSRLRTESVLHRFPQYIVCAAAAAPVKSSGKR